LPRRTPTLQDQDGGRCEEVAVAGAEELQHASAEEYWSRFEAVMGGPDGLMTYRYLGTYADVPSGGLEGGMKIRRDMRNPAGGLLAAPLSIALLNAGGVITDASGVPAPVLTTVHVLDDGKDVERVWITARDAGHRGRTLSFGDAALVVDDNHRDRVIAIAQRMGVTVGEAPPGYRYVDPGPGVADTPDLPPLHEAFGARRRGDAWELPELTQAIGSTSGSLHHGPIQVVLEAAAHELAAGEAGTDQLQIEDWSVMYTGRGKTGPFLTGGGVVRGGPGRYAARMRLVDEGNDNRVVATAVATFRDGS
jgi:hypothetical protein